MLLHVVSLFVRRASVLAGISLAVAAPGATEPGATLYERVAARLAARRDLDDLGRPPAELGVFGWMLGEWAIEVKVWATATTPERIERGTARITRVMGDHWLQMTDTYPDGTQDLGFLTFNRVTRQWVTVSLDSHGNALIAEAEADAWRDEQLVFVLPQAEILGEKVALRQTLRRIGHDEFILFNEERIADGSWIPVDEYRYRRNPDRIGRGDSVRAADPTGTRVIAQYLSVNSRGSGATARKKWFAPANS